MSCGCYTECPLPWSTLTVSLVINNVFTESFNVDVSPDPLFSTTTTALDATIVVNRVTLADKGVQHTIDGTSVSAVAELLDPGEFFLLSTDCCPCQWVLYVNWPDYVAAGTFVYHQDEQTAPFPIPAVDETTNINLAVFTEIFAQNTTCGQHTGWAAQDGTWPYGDHTPTDSGGGYTSPYEGAICRTSGIGAGYCFARWTIEDWGDMTDFGETCVGWNGPWGLFVEPYEYHDSGTGTGIGDLVTWDVTVTGDGYGFENSCDTSMTLTQSATWDSYYETVNSPNNFITTSVGSGTLSFAFT